MIRATFIIAILFTFWACTNTSGKSVNASSDKALHTSNSSRVLVELFTSQGCSSCPAADRLMGNIISKDTNVISLSYHVDYWDRLGWKDIFSNHEYTLRQQQYVNAIHAAPLYTPQAIVQGTYEMVGSNRMRVLDAINKVRAKSTDQTITAIAAVEGSTITTKYLLSKTKPNLQIVVTLVQNRATTSVANGENAGAQLTDYNIVRNLLVQPANDNGSIEINLPDDLKRDNASIVLFTQDEQTKEIGTII